VFSRHIYLYSFLRWPLLVTSLLFGIALNQSENIYNKTKLAIFMAGESSEEMMLGPFNIFGIRDPVSTETFRWAVQRHINNLLQYDQTYWEMMRRVEKRYQFPTASFLPYEDANLVLGVMVNFETDEYVRAVNSARGYGSGALTLLANALDNRVDRLVDAAPKSYFANSVRESRVRYPNTDRAPVLTDR